MPETARPTRRPTGRTPPFPQGVATVQGQSPSRNSTKKRLRQRSRSSARSPLPRLRSNPGPLLAIGNGQPQADPPTHRGRTTQPEPEPEVVNEAGAHWPAASVRRCTVPVTKSARCFSSAARTQGYCCRLPCFGGRPELHALRLSCRTASGARWAVGPRCRQRPRDRQRPAWTYDQASRKSRSRWIQEGRQDRLQIQTTAVLPWCCDVASPEPALAASDLHVVMCCAMCTVTCTQC